MLNALASMASWCVPREEITAPFSSTAVAVMKILVWLCWVALSVVIVYASACKGRVDLGIGAEHGGAVGIVGLVRENRVKYRPALAAFVRRASRTEESPWMKIVLSSRKKGRECWAILLGACFARLTKRRELRMKLLRRMVKSDCWTRERCWKEETRYRWNKSVPADKGIGLR